MSRIIRVALPTPVPTAFDYLPPTGQAIRLRAGQRVRVPFGRHQIIGLVIGVSEHSAVEPSRLKPVHQVIDAHPIVDHATLGLLQWASGYYQHPIGEVINAALPSRIRQGKRAELRGVAVWACTSQGLQTPMESLSRSPKQSVLLSALQQHNSGLDAAQLNTMQIHWRRPLQQLVAKGLVESRSRPCLDAAHTRRCECVNLNEHQQAAADSVCEKLGGFVRFLLEGVTGSGKTEVYLSVIERVLERSQQALVLVPEIGLTPQLVARFRARFEVPLAIIHSGLSDLQRHCAWHVARTGEAPIVIGTRSAVFTPLPRAGVIIVDEEHDTSFKQQEGFRYNARDLAVYRAQQLESPIILGSATPSLESVYNVKQGKYLLLSLPERAGRAQHPTLEVIDVRRQVMEGGISARLRHEVKAHLAEDGQALLFLNRRGFAPALLCHQCGWSAQCLHCDAHLTLHAADRRLRCHHCGAEQRPPAHCPECHSDDLRTTGVGTERVEQTLKHGFPATPIVRIDRDTTRRRDAMRTKLAEIQRGEHRILIGTQMLSKGHDFPHVTLVGILNIDQGLFSTDFRAMERTAQLIVQVAGRAGRAHKPGKVLLQTHQPDHPLLQMLLTEGYGAFCTAALEERRLANLPPYTYMGVLRAEAIGQDTAMQFLDQVLAHTPQAAAGGVTVAGPLPALMERRAGRYRAQLLASAPQRNQLQRVLRQWLAALHTSLNTRRVRWSLDVDPVDLY